MRNSCQPLDEPLFAGQDLDVSTRPEYGGALPLLGLLTAALGLVVLLTVLGNLVVILAVAYSPTLRCPTHALIVNLAVADLLLGVVVLPLSAVREITGLWLLGPTMREVWAAVDVLCCTASILSLCGISVDRYLGVSRPLAYPRVMTARRVRAIIAAVWVLAAAISLGPLLGWRDRRRGPDHVLLLQCHVNKHLGYVIFSACCSFYLPAAVILVLYGLVYRAAARHSSFLRAGRRVTRTEVTLRVHAGAPERQAGSPALPRVGKPWPETPGRLASSRAANFRREKKAAQTLGIVVGGFLLCWFPFFVVLPLDSACSSCDLSGAPFTITFWLGYCNSCLNPFIYVCWSRELRRAFQALACRGRRGHMQRRDALALGRPRAHSVSSCTGVALYRAH